MTLLESIKYLVALADRSPALPREMVQELAKMWRQIASGKSGTPIDYWAELTRTWLDQWGVIWDLPPAPMPTGEYPPLPDSWPAAPWGATLAALLASDAVTVDVLSALASYWYTAAAEDSDAQLQAVLDTAIAAFGLPKELKPSYTGWAPSAAP